jgi:hypothetical protein
MRWFIKGYESGTIEEGDHSKPKIYKAIVFVNQFSFRQKSVFNRI